MGRHLPSTSVSFLDEDQDNNHEESFVDVSRRALRYHAGSNKKCTNHENCPTFYDEDETLSAAAVAMLAVAIATLNTLVILRATGIHAYSRWGGRVDHTSECDRVFQGILAMFGIVAPVLLLKAFPSSTQEVIIIIGVGVILPYGIAAVALACKSSSGKSGSDDADPTDDTTQNQG